jgi:hypothetical protein
MERVQKQITGEGEKIQLKRPTDPIFFGNVTLITHTFFIWPKDDGDCG